MKHRQRGATFLGIVTILLILGTAVYAGIRLVPIYLDYMKVARSIEAGARRVRRDGHQPATDPQCARAPLGRRGHQGASAGRTSRSRSRRTGYDIHAAYEVEQQFLYNVYLLVKFDKTVTVQQ